MKSIITILFLCVINQIHAEEWRKLYHFNVNGQFSSQRIDNFQFINANVGYFSTYETTVGSSPGNADLYKTTNSGKDWEKIYTLFEWMMGSSSAIYFDFLDERTFFIFESQNGGLCQGKLFLDSVSASVGFTPYPPPYINLINPDTLIISNYSDGNYIFIYNPEQENLSKIEITDSYIYEYPYWYKEYDLIKSVSIISGFGAAIGERNGKNLLYTSNATYDVWVKDTLDIVGNLKQVYFKNKNTGFLIANDTILYRTQNGGSDWSEVSFPSSLSINDIQFGDTRGYVICNDGKVASSPDNGITWAIDSLESSSSMVHLSVVDDIAYLVDADGYIFTNNPAISSNYERLGKESIAMYPNPVNDLLYISSNKYIHQIIIFNTLGQLFEIYNDIHSYSYTLDISYLNTGIYFIEVTCDDKLSIYKIVKN